MMMPADLSTPQSITDDTDQVLLSMPEIGALALRTARGAGYSWGMAEECGYAATWLARHGAQWADIILARLSGERGSAIRPAAGTWRNDGPVCGLHTGVTLADFASLPEGPLGKGVTLGEILDPLCLLPFIARAAHATNSILDVIADDALWARIGPATATIVAPAPQEVALIHVRPDAGTPLDTAPRHLRQTARVTKLTYAMLEALALNMTVPATAQSQAGAGATGSDND